MLMYINLNEFINRYINFLTDQIIPKTGVIYP